MTPAEYYEREVQRVISALAPNGQIELRWSTSAEGRAHKRTVAQAQKELRLIKKQLGLEIHTLSSGFTSQRVMVGKGVGSGVTAGLLGRKNMGRANAIRRESFRADQERATAPYKAVQSLIERAVAQLDGLKVDIDRKLLSPSP